MTKDDALDIISDAGFCILGTTEGNQPRVRPLAPYYDADDNKLLISLVPGSRAKEQVKQNPLVELCFVDKKMSFCRLSGNAAISDSISKKELIWNNVPVLKQYFQGPEDPNFSLMEVSVSNAEVMTQASHKPEAVSF